MPIRKVWRYAPQLTDMSELKEGDIFRLQKSGPEDTECNEDEIYYASTDARPCHIEGRDTTHEVTAHRLMFDPEFGKDQDEYVQNPAMRPEGQ